MLKKKSASKDNKRKHPQTEEQYVNRRRRCTESEESKDELADAELDRVGSDIEEGGLDLSVPFQPISAYAADRREMLDQCFHVLGEKKLHKMLPDELKDCSIDEIKNLCWEQLEQISLKNLLQILGGEELTSEDDNVNTGVTLESQQDNNVDSTSSLKECVKAQDPKQVSECAGSGEESDVLSINADTYDSDIETPKEDLPLKTEEVTATVDVKDGDSAIPAEGSEPVNVPSPAEGQPPEAKNELEKDIDKSVSEILAISSASATEAAKEQRLSPQPAAVGVPAQSAPSSGTAPAVCQPSVQQLELLELEMRARAIKALMKASDGKKP